MNKRPISHLSGTSNAGALKEWDETLNAIAEQSANINLINQRHNYFKF